MPDDAPRLTFGLYPGMTGQEEGVSVIAAGPVPEDPPRTLRALAELQPGGRPLLVRAYVIFRGRGRALSWTPLTPELYAGEGRRLDLALCYRSQDGCIADWVDFVREMVARCGPFADAIQVTEEPNNPHPETGGDGASPNVLDAVLQGVVAAKAEARARELAVHIGLAVAPSFSPADTLWADLGERAGADFHGALDYVGLDFFPDVFRPLPHEQMEAAVEGVLAHTREVIRTRGGVADAVPLRITENGWPTGAERPPDRQAEVLERIVRTVDRLRGVLNITHYEHFMLRDGDSDSSDAGHQWGLLRHDYEPKPAWEAYRGLVAELSADVWGQ
jgi:hypothetical protein